jgi:hypothetical protein
LEKAKIQRQILDQWSLGAGLGGGDRLLKAPKELFEMIGILHILIIVVATRQIMHFLNL